MLDDLDADERAVLLVLNTNDVPAGLGVVDVVDLLARASRPVSRTSSEVGAVLAGLLMDGTIEVARAPAACPTRLRITALGRSALGIASS